MLLTGLTPEPDPGAGSDVTVLRPREPYNVQWMTWFLAAHAVPTMETFTDGVYRRSVRLPHGPAVLDMTFTDDGVHTRVNVADTRDAGSANAVIETILSLGTKPGSDDPDAVDDALSADPQLTDAVRAAPGIRVPGAADPVEILLRTMIGQQISLAAAATHTARLVAALGESVDPGQADGITRLFPTARAVAEHGASILTGPASRVSSIVAVAAAVADGDVDVSPSRSPRELERDLLTLRGIGPWTARYVAMRVARDSDVLLDTDLVVRQGADVLGLDLAKSERWAPYRSYVSMHLWRVALNARAANGRQASR